jgi:hypothetical protein
MMDTALVVRALLTPEQLHGIAKELDGACGIGQKDGTKTKRLRLSRDSLRDERESSPSFAPVRASESEDDGLDFRESPFEERERRHGDGDGR